MTYSFGQRLHLRIICALGGFAATAAIVGCGGSAQGDGSSIHVLSTAEAKRAIVTLPYRYTFRSVPLPKDATGVLAGRAVDRYHTAINFGIALGNDVKEGVSVPRSGTGEAYGYGGYIYTDDLQVPDGHGGWKANPRFKSLNQWHHAGDMDVEITEKLCRAETGEPCHEG